MADKTEFKLNIPAGGMKKATVPILGDVVKTKKEGVYAVKEPAIVGKQYMVICPVCGKPVLTKATEPIVFRTMHKTCNAPIIIKGVEMNNTATTDCNGSQVGQKADETSDQRPDAGSKGSDEVNVTGKEVRLGSKTNAKLSWWSMTGRKAFVLRIGKNYIGRRDNEFPSNLSLKDEYASARSICIDVNKTARGYTFHLTVEHATNPVLINGKDQPEGSSFDLNYGDTIKLGNTTLSFKPVKQ